MRRRLPLLLAAACICLTSTADAAKMSFLDDDELDLDFGSMAEEEYAGEGRFLVGNTTFNSTYALIFVAFVSSVIAATGIFLYFYESSTGIITAGRRTGFKGGEYDYYYYDGR